MAEVTFPTPAGPCAGYLARAPGDDARPAVVVIHEIFGLNDDIRRLTDRLAGMGYLALAPDFYGGGRWRRCMKAAFKQLKAGEGEFFEAIDAARAWLAADPGSTGAVGVVGFCLGGSFALLAAPRYDFAAASVNYGEVPKDPDVLGGACPVVASFGARDRTTRGRAQRLEGALVANGVEHDVKLIPRPGMDSSTRSRYHRRCQSSRG
jgi:carboxymethylenebutenolidase